MTTVAIGPLRRRVGGRTDVYLVKLPNHNIDYPHLATPTLTARLRAKLYAVEQTDINMELHDHLLTAPALQRIEEELLPQLLDFNRGNVEEIRRLRRFLEQFRAIRQTVGYAEIERQKILMQRRDYAAVFGRDTTMPPLAVFNVASVNRVLVDRALALAMLGESTLVSRFLTQQAELVAAQAPAVVGISLLQIQRPIVGNFYLRLGRRGERGIAL